jgi:Sulfotransferase domain
LSGVRIVAIQVVGAGVGRTGTLSLKAALEQLLEQPCYHMLEVFGHPDHASSWREAAEDGKVDWTELLGGYGATSDFPACLFWPEILEANPDAVVLLSTRRDSKTWWESASQTIFSIDAAHLPPEMAEWFEMWRAVATARFTADWTDEEASRAAYDRHNAEVRASVPSDRLVDWKPGDGWAPLCNALGVPVPGDQFPHLNTRDDFPRVSEDTTLAEALEHFPQGPGAD